MYFPARDSSSPSPSEVTSPMATLLNRRDPGQGSASERSPLHDDVVDQLRQMIIRCELVPGERFTEQKLVEKFGVSRTPLREALKILASEGLVEMRPHRGSSVSPISIEEISETFAVLGTLEEMAGPLVCDRVSNVDIARLERIKDEMSSKRDATDRNSYFELNVAFHQSMIALSGNAVLSATYNQLFGKLQRARYLVNDDQNRWSESAREHSWIMEALRQRDGAELSKRLREHNSRTAQAVLDKLRG
ncbi:GntR family transcriptional regulator [Ancylobacter sp. Lp-2]|uniref:GntR family transcriptional regulator n=1 Tax=Ancylobacter sp. Lp-2 TaxID=2881339 RepID=UPI001E3FEB85|nr:GntR family transcriptional regulator [Ancylobacter sp. Lp-2]MCB4767905.1 GntR family transcriptional regulator [Ancylobacter sp. Lp-2]